MIKHSLRQHKRLLKNLKMYFTPKVVEKFAAREQNEKNFRVAAIIDRIINLEIKNLKDPIYATELGGGAHPDRYHNFFKRLLKDPKGRIDWVDISPFMLEVAKKYINTEKYKNREEIINFIPDEILKYLEKLPKEKLDLVIMKYTIDHINDLKKLFKLLAQKLKLGGKLVATIGNLNPELKSISTNTRFLYNGKEFPKDETKILKNGDSFTVKFFKESNNPDAGYLEGAETIKYYHSPEKIKELAKKFNFDVFLGDWKGLVPKEKREDEDINQDVLILRKKINPLPGAQKLI